MILSMHRHTRQSFIGRAPVGGELEGNFNLASGQMGKHPETVFQHALRQGQFTVSKSFGPHQLTQEPMLEDADSRLRRKLLNMASLLTSKITP